MLSAVTRLQTPDDPGLSFTPPPEKFPHTRGLLAAIWRDNKPGEALLEAGPGTDSVDANLLTKATLCLEHEQGEELKVLLKESFGSPDDVSFVSPHFAT